MNAFSSRVWAVVLNAPVLWTGKLVRAFFRRVLLRGASAAPGLVVNALAPRLLTRMLRDFPLGLIVVTGSSGKSTTTKMVSALLRAHGLRVFTNSSSANLRQGVASALVEQSDSLGQLGADIGVVELDEAVAARLAAELRPRIVVLTNVMAEHLDRFPSAQHVAGLLAKAARFATEAVVANHDDQYLCELAGELTIPVRWFGTAVAAREAIPGGLGYARENPVADLDDRAATVLTNVVQQDAIFTVHGQKMHARLPARGIHFGVDAAAAIEATMTLLGDAFNQAMIVEVFTQLQPVFGRGEVVCVGGEDVEFVLVQNASSFQLNLDQLQPQPQQLLVAVGADVRDPSWLWSVRTSRLEHVDVVTGSKAFEIALRLAYDNVPFGAVTPDIAAAIPSFLSLPRPLGGLKTIVFSADSMRRIRRQLGLRIGEGTE